MKKIIKLIAGLSLIGFAGVSMAGAQLYKDQKLTLKISATGSGVITFANTTGVVSGKGFTGSFAFSSKSYADGINETISSANARIESFPDANNSIKFTYSLPTTTNPKCKAPSLLVITNQSKYGVRVTTN
nr:hypothetical protein [Gammaproteobacteria bacterium]